MNIYEILHKDHEKVLGLLDQLIEAKDLEVKKKLVQQIHDDLIPHARAEEAVLYNNIRDVEVAQDVVGHAYREHVEAETILRGLQLTEAAKIDWVKGAKALKESISHHIKEEETEVFTAGKKLFSEEEAVAMGEVFKKMKEMVKKESFIGTSVDALVNMMPTRLRGAFGKLSLEGRMSA